MKKLVFLVVFLCCILVISISSGCPKAPLIFLNGTQLNSEAAPLIIKGTTMVPVDLLSEGLGFKVIRNASHSKFTLEKADSKIEFTLNNPNAIIDGKNRKLNIAPFNKHGITMVPLRVIAEHYNLEAAWNQTNSHIDLLRFTSLQSIQSLGDEIQFTLDQSITPKLLNSDNPLHLEIEFPNTLLGTTQMQNIPIQSAYIQHIGYTSIYASRSNESPFVRVDLDLTQAVKVILLQEEDKKQITIQLVGALIPHYKVVIDPGHGGDDDGAESISHRNEKDFNLTVALKIRKLLANESKITLYLTRTEDTFISLDDRVNMANQLQADVYLSIHANIDRSSSTRGTETFYNRNNSLTFADSIQDYVQKATGFPDRHVAYDEYRVIKNTTMPAALVEVGFLSNAIEDKALFIESKQTEIAAAIVEGIKKYLGI